MGCDLYVCADVACYVVAIDIRFNSAVPIRTAIPIRAGIPIRRGKIKALAVELELPLDRVPLWHTLLMVS